MMIIKNKFLKIL